MYRSLLLAVGCALATGCASAQKPRPLVGNVSFLSPAEIHARMEASKVSYRVDAGESPREGWAEELWPQRIDTVDSPRVVTDQGERVVREWPSNPEADALLTEAEEHFVAERYAEAARLYERATKVCPKCYVAWTFLGDAAYFSGDAETALERYRKAASLNPHDHRVWFFQGNALAKLGRTQEAREAWATSLVLNPRNPVIRRFFLNNPQMGLIVRDDTIVPRALAAREGEAVAVTFDPTQDPAWLAFGMCKALWLGEPSHRQEMTGDAAEGFTVVEEVECLGNALSVHVAQKGKKDPKQEGEAVSDPTLDDLVRIGKDNMLQEVVVFELGARMYPQIVLTLDDAMRERLKAYVLKYVLIPAGPVEKDIDL